MKKSDFDLKHQNQTTESKIVASLEKISQAFRVLLWQESREYSLSPIQVQVMIFLLHHSEEKRKVSYLAAEFNMTKATISDTVKALDQKGLIEKIYETGDARSYSIHLTERGREMAERTSLFTRELRTPIDKLHDDDKENLLLSLLNIIRHLNRADDDDKENLLLSLLNIIRHLNRAGVITVPRMCMTCAYYHSSENGQKHFCKLLNQHLQVTDLRIDCPEHELKV